MLVCPFDKSHIVKYTRFNNHVAKCQLSHPNMEFNTCVFNSNHITKTEDTMDHFDSCPDRIPHSAVLHMMHHRRNYQVQIENTNPNTFQPINDSDFEPYDTASQMSNISSSFCQSEMSRQRSSASEVSFSFDKILKRCAEIKAERELNNTPGSDNARKWIAENDKLRPDGAASLSSFSRVGSAFSSYSTRYSDARSHLTEDSRTLWDIIPKE